MSKVFLWPFRRAWTALATICAMCFAVRAILNPRFMRVPELDGLLRFFQFGQYAYLIDLLCVIGMLTGMTAAFAIYLALEKKFGPK
jgi:hypothetical protein